MNEWVEHNKKEFGVKIVELKIIIKRQIRASGKSDEFTSDMLVALQSGRKITPKMEEAINGIVNRNKPEELVKRKDWVESVVPKIMMVSNLVKETSWGANYKYGKESFLESIKKQAMSNMRLSKKQMEVVNNIYKQCKKNIEKNENKS
tara:strand:+ start:724 stop:1167 length:444 start_codon:yes stop_codon:yes gene_type:complete